MELHLKILRPRFAENLGIINGDLIGNSRGVNKPKAFDDVQRVAMIGDRLDTVVLVSTRFVAGKGPLLQADRIDDECVAVPLADGISHPGQIQILRMWTAVQWN